METFNREIRHYHETPIEQLRKEYGEQHGDEKPMGVVLKEMTEMKLLTPEDVSPDIDVIKLFNELEPEQSMGVGICEGCGLIGIAKMLEDPTVIYAAYYGNDYKKDDLVKWVKYWE
jgi:hypothetical protein